MFHYLTRTRGLAVALVCALLLSWPLPAQTLRTKPDQVGLSSERLSRIGETIQRHIHAGDIASAVTLVARRGRVAHLEAFGQLDIESRKPAATDSLFRIASMSKPVTGVAILMLVEEGKILAPIRFLGHTNSRAPGIGRDAFLAAERGSS